MTAAVAPIRVCAHYAQRGGCFYGGAMVDDVYPGGAGRATRCCCSVPNYNDALSANIMAFINRLTSLHGP